MAEKFFGKIQLSHIPGNTQSIALINQSVPELDSLNQTMEVTGAFNLLNVAGGNSQFVSTQVMPLHQPQSAGIPLSKENRVPSRWTVAQRAVKYAHKFTGQEKEAYGGNEEQLDQEALEARLSVKELFFRFLKLQLAESIALHPQHIQLRLILAQLYKEKL